MSCQITQDWPQNAAINCQIVLTACDSHIYRSLTLGSLTALLMLTSDQYQLPGTETLVPKFELHGNNCSENSTPKITEKWWHLFCPLRNMRMNKLTKTSVTDSHQTCTAAKNQVPRSAGSDDKSTFKIYRILRQNHFAWIQGLQDLTTKQKLWSRISRIQR